MIPDKREYLKEEATELNRIWPDNKCMNIVCHGHSIPCGYTTNHVVRMQDAYPRLLHDLLCSRFPMAVINVIVTSIGGENAVSGAKRLESDVLIHKPSILTIDYGRNDMFCPLEEVEKAWRRMIEGALEKNCKILLITPAPDCGQPYYEIEKKLNSDEEITAMIARLATEYEIGMADAEGAFHKELSSGKSISDFLLSVNHPGRAGHQIIAGEILQWFPYPNPFD